MATVNQLKFLQDTTGNRRFWPLVIVSKIAPLPPNMAVAIWTWAWDAYLEGEQWWLTPEEEALHAEIVAAHEDKPMRESLLDCYDFESEQRNQILSSTQIINEIGWNKNDRSAKTALGIALKGLGVEGFKREYRMPPRTASNGYNL